MTIEPIDKEFNEQLLTGKGLDANLFNLKEVLQYYQVSNYEELSDDELELKLDAFIIETYKIKEPANYNELSILFYKKQEGINYSKQLYESARDNQNGMLEEHKSNLVSIIRIERIKEVDDRLIRHKIFYKKDKDAIERTDTLSIK
jgi:hypothetical protein